MIPLIGLVISGYVGLRCIEAIFRSPVQFQSAGGRLIAKPKPKSKKERRGS
jgi:hypothetical protein